MFRLAMAIIAIATLALGLATLNYDVAKSLDARLLHATKLGELWYAVHPNSLLLLQPAVERHLAEWLWDPVIQTILEQPAWLVLGVLGAIFALLSRRPSNLPRAG
jgi:hypothetical protein